MLEHAKVARRKYKQGDSIIEVLLAIAIFSAISVASLTTMNRGQANLEAALEETVVRSEIDYQADLIRFIYNGYISATSKYKGTWEQMIESQGGEKTIDSVCSNNKLQKGGKGSFVLTSQDGDVEFFSKTKYAQSGGVPRASNSKDEKSDIWVTVDEKDKYYDFYINTCWYAPGSSIGTTLNTVIRLAKPIAS